MDNPFQVLGINSDSSDEEIKEAYKRLAKKYHPDSNPDDPFAVEKMMKINAAYHDIQRFGTSAFQSYSRKTTDSFSNDSFYEEATSYNDSDDDFFYDTEDDLDTNFSFKSTLKKYILFINKHYFKIGFALILVVAVIALFTNNQNITDTDQTISASSSSGTTYTSDQNTSSYEKTGQNSTNDDTNIHKQDENQHQQNFNHAPFNYPQN